MDRKAAESLAKLSLKQIKMLGISYRALIDLKVIEHNGAEICSFLGYLSGTNNYLVFNELIDYMSSDEIINYYKREVFYKNENDHEDFHFYNGIDRKSTRLNSSH